MGGIFVITSSHMQTNHMPAPHITPSAWLPPFFLGLLLHALLSPPTGALCGESNPSVSLKLHASGFTSPVAFAPLNDGQGTMVVADQVGTLSLVNSAGIQRGQPFLSITDRITKLNAGFDERGILGFASHPDFLRTGKIYVYYSAPLDAHADQEWDHTSRISEFSVYEDDPELVDPRSERILLTFDQPYFNHNAGALAFGPQDGFLYIATGDGGNANGRGLGHSDIGNSQDLSNLLGKILRIDVHQGQPYAIPSDNPFQGADQRAEIYAIGLRNPWRMSFDRGGSHELFVADIGQNLFEEVNLITKGGNYGWNIREGRHCFDPDSPRSAPEACSQTDVRGQALVDPIIEYKNLNAFRGEPDAYGISVTGGYVYRGSKLKGLEGTYIFADWSQNWALPQGVLLAASPQSDGTWNVRRLSHGDPVLGGYIVAFGEDEKGELYVLTNASNQLINRSGNVFKLLPGS